MSDDVKDEMQNGSNQQINIELGEKEAEGVYSNLAIISHSTAEFVIDFTRNSAWCTACTRSLAYCDDAAACSHAPERNAGEYQPVRSSVRRDQR